MAFQPGQSGNPAGSKPTRDWAAAIKRALARRGDGDYYAGVNRLADKLLDAAEAGELAALKELGDRLDGKPAQTVDLGNKDGEAFVTRVENHIIDPAA